MSVCESCNNNRANVHVTQISQGATALVHLCEECAAKKGVSLSVDIHAGMLQPQEQSHAHLQEDVFCPGCNLTIHEFNTHGWLGCSLCYTAFEEYINQFLKKMYGSNVQMSKSYSSVTPIPQKALSIEVLSQKLLIAIREEDFESAARLRDVIKTIQFSPAQTDSTRDDA